MDKIQEIINKLTVKEKLSLFIGKNYWQTNEIKRLNIRSITTSDGPHGLRKQDGKTDNIGFNSSNNATCFPLACALACSFDRDALKEVGTLLSFECKNQNVDVLLAPAVNIKRHLLCGRNFEYYSEDPLLTGILASNFINAMQENDIGCCIKHFALNNQEHRRQISNSVVDIDTMHNLYLKPFKIAISSSNPSFVMSSYNLINGTYASENKYLLKDILRDELNYKGAVISDWGAVSSVLDSFKNGLNLEMPGVDKTRIKYLYKEYKKGNLTDKEIDEIIYPIVKYSMNMKNEYLDVDYLSHHKKAIDIADKCTVLIKNDNILPLTQSDKVLIVGDFAFDIRFLGGGSSNVNPYVLNQINDLVKDYSNNVLCIRGYDNKTNKIIAHDLDLIKNNISNYDKVIYLCGLTNEDESESYDRKSFELNKCQTDLYNEISKLTDNIVCLCISGSPFDASFTKNAKGIIIKYLCGQASSESILNTLYGISNPSGRLAETWPVKLDDVCVKKFPETDFNVLYTEGEYIGYKHFNLYNIMPLFPFGYGISYSVHKYDNFSYDNKLKVLSFTLTNVSNIKGSEVIQLYIQTKDRKYISLVYFDKISLDAHKQKTVKINILDSFFMQYNKNTKSDECCSGHFYVSIRKNSLEAIYEFEYISKVGEQFVTPKTNHVLKKYDCNNNVKGYFNLNSTILDLNNCLIGRITNKGLSLIIKIYKRKHKDIAKVIEESIATSPIRIFTLGTNGFIGYRGLNRFIKVMNGFRKRK